MTIGDHHLRELESLLLRTVKPSGNKQKGKFANADNLGTQFRRDVKRSVMAQVEGLFSDSRPAQRQRREPLKRSEGRRPVLAEYVSAPMKLRARFKGRTVRARVRRDGTVRYAGKVYTSPSLAAGAACKRRTCNGWRFWHYERAPGDWVPLDALRR